MKPLTSLLAVVAVSAGLAAPAAAQKPTLTELVAASGGEFDQDRTDYDILLNAVIAADLADALDNPNDSLTLFAPTDLGFIRLARDLGYQGFDEEGAFNAIVAALTDLGGGDPIPLLTDVLLYHVAPESLGPVQVLFSSSIATLQGETIRPKFFILRDKEPDLRNPRLILPINVKASNGRLHTINRVLLPVNLP